MIVVLCYCVLLCWSSDNDKVWHNLLLFSLIRSLCCENRASETTHLPPHKTFPSLLDLKADSVKLSEIHREVGKLCAFLGGFDRFYQIWGRKVCSTNLEGSVFHGGLWNFPDLREVNMIYFCLGWGKPKVEYYSDYEQGKLGCTKVALTA